MGFVPHNPYWLLVIISLQILTYRSPEGKELGHPMTKTEKKEFFGSRRNQFLSSDLLFKPLSIEKHTALCLGERR